MLNNINPDDWSDRDEAILAGRIAGKSTRSLAREFRCRPAEIDAVLDRMLPRIDVAARVRALAIEMIRLDELYSAFEEKARKKLDSEAGQLCVRISERRCALLGLDTPREQFHNVALVQQQPRESSTVALMRVIDRVLLDRNPPDELPETAAIGGADSLAGH